MANSSVGRRVPTVAPPRAAAGVRNRRGDDPRPEPEAAEPRVARTVLAPEADPVPVRRGLRASRGLLVEPPSSPAAIISS